MLALSLADGQTIWRRQAEGSIHIAPGASGDTVYSGNIDGLVVARAATTDDEQWRVWIENEPWLSTIPVVFDGRVWFGTLNGQLHALSSDGVQTSVAIETPTTPAVGADRLYVGSSAFGGDEPNGRSTVVAVAPDRSRAWTATTRGTSQSAVGLRDGRVVTGTSTGAIESLAASDGSQQWRTFARPSQLPQPVVGPATAYCGSHSTSVTGYRVTDGTHHLWYVGFDGTAPGTPAVLDETVIAGSHAGDLAATP
ncbi:PQQ-binding-like beta-propeller repeat protein [Halomicrobium salinisoli]|uniref:outer membrane protein assembly factor BamB family protein n=1 Tax=Halomicrobium salinisoli TaxID=2878391 RepID=UPI001F0A846C|nr:PQQ-binding-like beta-propeller repeat protein [Halomicrobium salinisoli]